MPKQTNSSALRLGAHHAIQPRQIDLRAAHLSRMFLAVFRARAVVLYAQSVAYLVEQAW